MKELKKAFRPLKGRIRFLHGLRGGALGLCVGAGAALILMLLSFLVPIRNKAILGIILLGFGAAAGALCGLLWPVSDAKAARTGDRCGLKERLQTALAFPGDSPMEQLQRQDAAAALAAFDVKKIPRPRLKRPLLLAGGAACLAAALLLLPNPQNAALEQADAYRKIVEEAAEQAEEAVEAPENALTEEQKQELRRLTGDLERKLFQAKDPADVLLALNEGQERLEKMRDAMAGERMDALAQSLAGQGLDALAQALQSGDEAALENALDGLDADALEQAAQALSGEMGNLMNAAAAALKTGDLAAALENLRSLAAAAGSLSEAQLAALAQMLQNLRAGLGGQQGQGKGQGLGLAAGEGAQGAQTGAGRGSTNEDMTSDAADESGFAGADDPRYKEGTYESIYDPTRLDADQTELVAQSPRNEGDAAQLNVGPGAGSLDGSVPYNQVALEYAEAAARAAESQNLTNRERQWVADYFASLTE